MAWATIDELEAFIGITADARMQSALDVSLAYCTRQRPDLDPYNTPDAAITQAVLIYAGLLYRERSTPQGFATYEDQQSGQIQDQSAMLNVYRLLGSRRPVAR